mmetsp:Transcript_6998/g.20287  ORF Transcript_6998/g.20287 Transcript_6998/m.20287 type:complete len:123 (+) Transcript_6998:740-1108(+)
MSPGQHEKCLDGPRNENQWFRRKVFFFDCICICSGKLFLQDSQSGTQLDELRSFELFYLLVFIKLCFFGYAPPPPVFSFQSSSPPQSIYAELDRSYPTTFSQQPQFLDPWTLYNEMEMEAKE